MKLFDESTPRARAYVPRASTPRRGGILLPLAGSLLLVGCGANPAPGVTVGDPAAGHIDEANGSTTATYVLNLAPNGTTILNVVSNNPAKATATPTQLTFDPTNWNTPQEILIVAQDDRVADGDVEVLIGASVDVNSTDTTGYADLTISSISVAVVDDDVAGYLSTNPAAELSEGGASGTTSLALSSQPNGEVVIVLSSSDLTGATVSPSQVTFSPLDWDASQLVTVSPVDDPLVDGPQTVTIFAAVSSTTDTTGYANLATQAIMEASVADNDVASILMFPASGAQNGNMSGRAGADARCAATASAVATCGSRSKIHAFLTVTAADQMQSMPANFGLNAAAPITSLNGQAFATDWLAMFVGDGTGPGHYNEIPYSLADAGILPANTRFWSGTARNTPAGLDPGAPFDLYTCAYFTSSGSTLADVGLAGNSSKKHAGWLGDGTLSGNTLYTDWARCDQPYALLCVCGD